MSKRRGLSEKPSPSETYLTERSAIPWWIRIVVSLVALLLAAGAGIALVHPEMMLAPGDAMNGAAHIYAGYMASRNFALAIMLVVLLILSAKRALANVMVLVALVQLLDAGIDCAEGRWTIVPGVLIIGLVFVIAAARLSGNPFWKAEAWRP